MKKNIIISALLLLICQLSWAQSRVNESELIGTWKLVIDIEEAMDEAKREVDQENSYLGSIILKSVSGLVEGIIEGIDIHMEFERGGYVRININAYGEREVEDSDWYINRNGELYIDDTDSYSSDDGDYWLMDGDVLILVEEDGDISENVYMVKVD